MRLGNIIFSNCFPVHARLIDHPRAGDPELIDGIPSYLNGLLRAGEVDVSPSSSIEFARNAERYRILPDLVIGARGAVRSILLIGAMEPRALDGRVVALPTASATSVVLLQILLRHRWGVRPEFVWFDQAHEDPFRAGAAAALFIGDVALREGLHPEQPVRLDLGEEWLDETGLPFAFAIWQAVSEDHAGLQRLRSELVASREFGLQYRKELAMRHADRFSLPATLLERYWGELSYELDAPMLEGLRTFYRLAKRIGALDREPELRWTE